LRVGQAGEVLRDRELVRHLHDLLIVEALAKRCFRQFRPASAAGPDFTARPGNLDACTNRIFGCDTATTVGMPEANERKYVSLSFRAALMAQPLLLDTPASERSSLAQPVNCTSCVLG
jgi:hypothetical protein